MKKLITAIACILVLALSLTACGTAAAAPRGGTICLKVNPEIAVSYDENGSVTKIEARNEDGEKIIADYTAYEGAPVKTVLADLVKAIGEAGYFVEEVEGQRRRITLDLEDGSYIPSGEFMKEIEEALTQVVTGENWFASLEVGDDDIRTCTNPHCDDEDCDDLNCDEGPEDDDIRSCTNPHCDDEDCDDLNCDEGPEDDDVRTCTNPHCHDDDCDDADCDEGAKHGHH